MRIVFVNLHGNEFLVKTLNKILFKQSVAIKHKYFLDYLLSRDDIEVCSFINKRGLSLSFTTQNKFLQAFRFLEHRITMRSNGINQNAIKVIKREDEIQNGDVLILYQMFPQFEFNRRPDNFIAVSMIHYTTGNTRNILNLPADALFSESRLDKYSLVYKHDFKDFHGEYLLQPFVFAPRFKPIKPFNERKNKAVAVGTITYPDYIQKYYGTNCIQPARKQIKDNAKMLEPWIDCFSSDYLEDDNDVKKYRFIPRVIRRLYAKIFTGHQKAYYSFDMVEKFNDYKICVVGEEITGIPGIGFVEGMACGCAYIGQMVGYYEDYGMIEGVHYIGYDSTLDDLKSKISYYRQPEHQNELEAIAKSGCEFVRGHFNGTEAAKQLLNNLLDAQKRWVAKKQS